MGLGFTYMRLMPMSYQYPTLENYPVYSSNSFDEVGDSQGAEPVPALLVGDDDFMGGQ